MQIKIKT